MNKLTHMWRIECDDFCNTWHCCVDVYDESDNMIFSCEYVQWDHGKGDYGNYCSYDESLLQDEQDELKNAMLRDAIIKYLDNNANPEAAWLECIDKKAAAEAVSTMKQALLTGYGFLVGGGRFSNMGKWVFFKTREAADKMWEEIPDGNAWGYYNLQESVEKDKATEILHKEYLAILHYQTASKEIYSGTTIWFDGIWEDIIL